MKKIFSKNIQINDYRRNMKLSICYPVYNRLEVFAFSLLSLLNSIKDHNNIEIVIIDDASEEKMSEFLLKIIRNSSNKIRYYRNEKNLRGLNFFEVISKASGEYCWIVGTDDFFTNDGILHVMNHLESSHQSVIIGNYGLYDIDISELRNSSDKVEDLILRSSNYKKNLFFSNNQYGSLSNFVSSNFPNHFLGAMMVVIFNRDIWIKTVQKYKAEYISSAIFDWYPHVFVFAKGFMNQPTHYLNNEIIIAGNGIRDWTSEDENEKWNSFYPLIYIYITRKLIDLYHDNGLKHYRYVYEILIDSVSVGDNLINLFINWSLMKSNPKGMSVKIIINVILSNLLSPGFYYGILKGVIRKIFKTQTN